MTGFGGYFRCLLTLLLLWAVFPFGTPASAIVGIDPDNATYIGIYAQAIKLQAGRWTGKPFVFGGASRPRVELVRDFKLAGDLDGDGREEKIVILRENSGGSGTNYYLAVLGRRDGRTINYSTVLLGDRVQLRAWRLVGEKIILDLVQAGPGDPAGCPSLKVVRSWVLGENRRLFESGTRQKGRLSLADFQGVEWVLLQLKAGEPVSRSVVVSLRFRGRRLEGHSGCNRYFATVKENGDLPGQLTIVGISGTKKSCATPLMRLEKRYLAALTGVVGYRFVVGRLGLDWNNNREGGLLLFAPRSLSPRTQN